MRKKYYCAAEYRTLIPAKKNRHSGVREHATEIISSVEMRVAERNFWLKRGLSCPPGMSLGRAV